MFVRIYTVPAVCVVVQGRAVFAAHVKNKCVMMMMIDEEYTIWLRFPRKERYSPLMSRKMVVGYDSYLL